MSHSGQSPLAAQSSNGASTATGVPRVEGKDDELWEIPGESEEAAAAAAALREKELAELRAELAEDDAGPELVAPAPVALAPAAVELAAHGGAFPEVPAAPAPAVEPPAEPAYAFRRIGGLTELEAAVGLP